MEIEKTKLSIVGFLFLIFLPSVFGVPVDWWGIVTIDGSITNGAVVDAYINGSSISSASAIVGEYTSGYYLIHVPCSQGDTITLKVYGITAGNYTCNTTPKEPNEETNLSVSKIADGLSCPSSYTGQSGTVHLGCSGGYCVHGICRSSSIYCGDGYCDTGERCTADNSGCPEGYVCTNGCVPISIISGKITIIGEAEETKFIPYIAAGSNRSVTFEKEDEIGIQKITIKVRNDVSNVEIFVKKETTKPKDVPEPQGIIYSYLNITLRNISSNDIELITMRFKVNKIWINENNINKSSIGLNKYSKFGWEQVSTTLIGEDELYVYFEAETPGFSIFAITGEKLQLVCTPQQKRCFGNKLQQCTFNGTKWLTIEDCQYGCDEKRLVCKTPICTPNEMKCVGKTIYKCNQNGTGWEVKKVCETGCVNGECLQPSYNWIWLILSILIVLVFIVYYYKRR